MKTKSTIVCLAFDPWQRNRLMQILGLFSLLFLTWAWTIWDAIGF